ncbi:hypothetical protein Areg01_29700 [Actinoplanes regularis]|nr:hypothetical protein Areg01_29700 [Actinoplanes regularis]
MCVRWNRQTCWPRQWVDKTNVTDMSKDGLARLVVSLMVVGGVAAVDASRPLHAHAALLGAVKAPGGESLPPFFSIDEFRAVPDSGVGLRVVGLTQALWEAVGRGWLEPQGVGGRALFLLSDSAAQDLAGEIGRLNEAQSRALRQAGDAWARASTSLKNLLSALSSSGSA